VLHAIERLAAMKPGLGVAQRASILVVASGPYHPQAATIQRVPLAGLVLAGTVRGFHIMLTAGPLVAFERTADAVLGTPTTPAGVNAHRWMILSGTATTMIAGMALQRTLNHSHLRGPVVEAGRIVGTQLSIGAAASAIVVATDIVLGESGRGKLNHPATALVFGGMIASAQSKALASVAARVTLPTQRVIAPTRGHGR
jgi:hypothetical protein